MRRLENTVWGQMRGSSIGIALKLFWRLECALLPGDKSRDTTLDRTQLEARAAAKQTVAEDVTHDQDVQF